MRRPFLPFILSICAGSWVFASACSSQPEAPPSQAPSVKAPVTGKWGFDLDGMDRSVNPGDDFYRYAVGTWVKNTTLPGDMPGLDTNTGLVIREPLLRRLVATNPHPPNEFRVQGIVGNMDGWYDAFGVKPEAKLYLSPDERVRIW